MQLEFWLVAMAVSVPVAGALILALLRGKPATQSERDLEIAFLASQLREIEREAARGTLDESSAEDARIDVSRKLLALNESGESPAKAPRAPRSATTMLAIVVGLVVVPGAIYVHSMVGAPNAPDMPLKVRLADAEAIRENRPSQAAYVAQFGLQEPDLSNVDPTYLGLMGQLRAAVTENPDSMQGLELLVRHESALGRFAAAAEAQERIVELKGESSTAEDFANLAELLILAADGYVSPEAEESLASALEREPEHHASTYYTGLLYAQTGRPDRTLRIWGRMLELETVDPELLEGIRAQLPVVAQVAGMEFSLPPAEASGPTDEDIAAAATLTDEERATLIQGMVQNLEDRLFDVGGTADEWARLIRSLDVLGKAERARYAWVTAYALFKDDEDALRIIQIEAAKAGVAE